MPFIESVKSYHEALKCEISVSCFWGRHVGLADPALRVPNSFVYNKLFDRLNPFLAPIFPIVSFIWVLVGLPLFSICFGLCWSCSPGWKKKSVLPAQFYLHSSNDFNVQFVSLDSCRPTTALLLPFHQSGFPVLWSTHNIDLRQVTSRYSLIRAVLLSIFAGWSIFMSPNRKYLLFTYSAPGWFWVKEALDLAAPASIWISNHLDRWASLASSISSARVTIVQHGDLTHYDSENGERLLARLPFKLSRVERVFVTDQESISDFEASITGKGPHFEPIHVSISTESWPLTVPNACKILIVGHPILHRTFGLLISETCSRFGSSVSFAYRPHPTESLPVVLPFVDSSSIYCLHSGQTVPCADIVVSYQSSVTPHIINATGAKLVSIGWDCDTPENFQFALRELLVTVRSVMCAIP